MKSILVYSFLFIHLIATAQISIDWKKNIGFERNDALQAVIEDQNGDIVIVGESQNEDINLDMWSVKMNTKGEVIWSKTFEEAGHQSAFSILENEEGYLVGVNNVHIGKPAKPFFIQLDKNGQELKRQPFLYQHNLRLNKFIAHKEYYYAVGRKTKGNNTDFVIGTLLKLNHDFDIVWEKEFEPEQQYSTHPITKLVSSYPSTTDPRDVLVFDNETLILTGYTSSEKFTDFWTVRVNEATQEVIWESKINEIKGGDEAFQVHKTEDNQIVMIGSRYDKGGNFPYRGNLIKHNVEDGEVMFSELYETKETQYYDRIIRSTPVSKGFLSVGMSGDNPWNAEGAIADLDIWIVYTNEDGKMEWETVVEQPSEQQGTHILKTSDGSYFVFAKNYDEAGRTDLQILKLIFP